ncbi:MAG: hypothetical protein ACFB6S_19120 [Geminicoccaceae bacterium]
MPSSIHFGKHADAIRDATRLRPRHIISCLDPGCHRPRFPGVRVLHHLCLEFDDVEHEALNGARPPGDEDMERVLRLNHHAQGEDIFVHSHQGLGRAATIAYVLMCLRHPAGREADVALCIGDRAPFVRINRRMVEIADRLSGRNGLLTAGLTAMQPPTARHCAATVSLPPSL